VLKAEERIAGINCDIADFLSEMSLDPSEHVIICVNAGASIKRNEAAVGGHYWMQGDRKMTALNGVLDGLSNDRESAILSAVVEAVEWRHCLEMIDPQRSGQRVIIHPIELLHLEAVLEAQDPILDSGNGHPIAHAKILEACQFFTDQPRFYREDCEEIRNSEALSDNVPLWMNTAALVSTGSRQQVLECGADAMSSSDSDSETGERGEGLTKMYTDEMLDSNGNPKGGGPQKISANQAMIQRLAAAAQREKSAAAQQAERMPRAHSMGPGSSDDDDPEGEPMVWSQTKHCLRPNKNLAKSREEASGAGSLRAGGGSGSTGARVAMPRAGCK
jgi:hypothetical protein